MTLRRYPSVLHSAIQEQCNLDAILNHTDLSFPGTQREWGLSHGVVKMVEITDENILYKPHRVFFFMMTGLVPGLVS